MYGHEASSRLAQISSGLDEEIGAWEQTLADTQADQARVEEEWAQVRRSLAGVYLPALTPEAIADAQQRTGFRGFTRRDPLVAMQREGERLAQLITNIRGDDRYVRRDALVGAMGSVTLRLQEAKGYLEPWQTECAKFEDLDGFLELVELGYDTPAFAERWWQPAYWRHWSRGDAICAALGLADFGDDVLPAYEKVRAPRDQWRAEVAKVNTEIEAVHQLVQTHDRAVERLGRLAEIYLEECQGVLAEHLATADSALLSSWSPEDRAVQVGLKAVSAVRAKREALTDMVARGIPGTVAQLKAEQEKVRVKRIKLARPKKQWMQMSPVGVGWEARRGKMAAARRKLADQRRRVVVFDAYDRYALPDEDFLWWLAFSNGRPPGIWTPGFHDWYQRHPHVRYDRVDPDDDPVATNLGADDSLSVMGDIS